GLFEVAMRLFVLVGLTFTKLSAWLPVVALTLTTGSRQVSGTNSRSVGFGARSVGIMHLRVPSGTSIPLVAPSSRACNTDVADVRNAKTAARLIRWRRVFIWILIDAAGKSGLKRTGNRRDSWMISEQVSRFIVRLVY